MANETFQDRLKSIGIDRIEQTILDAIQARARGRTIGDTFSNFITSPINMSFGGGDILEEIYHTTLQGGDLSPYGISRERARELEGVGQESSSQVGGFLTPGRDVSDDAGQAENRYAFAKREAEEAEILRKQAEMFKAERALALQAQRDAEARRLEQQERLRQEQLNRTRKNLETFNSSTSAASGGGRLPFFGLGVTPPPVSSRTPVQPPPGQRNPYKRQQ